MIDNPQRIQAAGLNHAIRAARGEVIARMDVHADYAPDYLEKCVEVLDRTGADNVGGAARCRAKGAVQRAICRRAAEPARVWRGLVPRSRSGGLRGHAVSWGFSARGVRQGRAVRRRRRRSNEDAELNQRILQAGGRIFLSREIVVYYYPRDSLAATRAPVLPVRPGPRADAAEAPPLHPPASRRSLLGLVTWIVAAIVAPRFAGRGGARLRPRDRPRGRAPGPPPRGAGRRHLAGFPDHARLPRDRLRLRAVTVSVPAELVRRVTRRVWLAVEPCHTPRATGLLLHG